MCTLLTELGHDVSTPSPFMVDNQSTLRVLKNPELHNQMKHIDIEMHWMIANIFTKPLPKPAVERHPLALGLE